MSASLVAQGHNVDSDSRPLENLRMAFREHFRKQSALQRALDRGLQPGAKLSRELQVLENAPVSSRADAEAIVGALVRVSNDPGLGGESGFSGFRQIVRLFQDVEDGDCPAFGILATRGMSVLLAIVNEAIADDVRWDQHDILLALKVLAMYRTGEGTDAVIQAARVAILPTNYMWSVVLRVYSQPHPHRDRLFKALSDPLPSDDIALALLEAANEALVEGIATSHPFDSDAGVCKLREWLRDQNPNRVGHAVSANAALPFIKHAERDALLALALDHSDVRVQLEAAWAAAKLGRAAGMRCLARYCLDLNHAETAKRYLDEIGRKDAIPDAANDPDFAAKAEFVHWLSHPSELGRAPDAVSIYDARTLRWPPERAEIPCWLIEYRASDPDGLKPDDVGIGMVGSMTFCFFSYQLWQRAPEDCYAIHCCWEMEHQNLITIDDVEDASTEYDQMLTQWPGRRPEDLRIVRIAEISAELEYPQRMVAMATGRVGDQSGWLVLDGARSRWYSQSDMPPDESNDATMLKVHIGRHLLGFTTHPDRRAFLRTAPSARPTVEIMAAYERLLERAREGDEEADRIIESYGPLATGFDDYASAIAETRQISREQAAIAAYETVLESLRPVAMTNKGVFDSSGPLGGDGFEAYVDGLVSRGRQRDVSSLIRVLQPHWQHPLGYGVLGAAAYRAGDAQLAEQLFRQLREKYRDWRRSEEMGSLATIWVQSGRADQAHTLLIDALNGLVTESRAAKGSDRQLFEKWFQNQRGAYLRLFPERGDSMLATFGVPTSTLAMPA